MTKFLGLIILGFILFTGCGERKHGDNYNLDTEKEGPVRQDTDTTLVDTGKSDTTLSHKNIVREGLIDLASIDENKNKKIFQCQMDWNVISDHPGNCPLCKMELEEVSLAKAKDNLIKNDYHVK